jgi:hypothetical protein
MIPATGERCEEVSDDEPSITETTPNARRTTHTTERRANPGYRSMSPHGTGESWSNPDVGHGLALGRGCPTSYFDLKK